MAVFFPTVKHLHTYSITYPLMSFAYTVFSSPALLNSHFASSRNNANACSFKFPYKFPIPVQSHTPNWVNKLLGTMGSECRININPCIYPFTLIRLPFRYQSGQCIDILANNKHEINPTQPPLLSQLVFSLTLWPRGDNLQPFSALLWITNKTRQRRQIHLWLA